MLSLDSFYPDKSHADGHHSVCKECMKADRKARYAADPQLHLQRHKKWAAANRERTRQYARERRRRVLEAYGGACACCGETTPEFLSIDHVYNDGEAHRRELQGYGKSMTLWLWQNGCPQDGRFQLLCHNCNMAKGLYGGCPHKGKPPGYRGKYTALPLEFCSTRAS